jgi:diaminopimelate epimerase
VLIEFSKMHGLGNDFMVVDAINQEVVFSPETVRRLADRHRGVGFDQLLLVEPPRAGHLDFHYTILNYDGDEVEQCGNGARCFARFVYDKGLTDKRTIRVGTIAVEMTLELAEDGSVTADMGIPRFEPENIPFTGGEEALQYSLDIEGGAVACGIVSMGNPHCVVPVDAIDDAPVASKAPALMRHPHFPQMANVTFMEVVTSEHLRLRTYERPGHETQACGSGACAATVIGRIQGKLSENVDVDVPGGRLHVGWAGRGEPVMMTGPTAHVYDGRIEI